MNIVFDLGGVILRWAPEELILRWIDEPTRIPVVREALFGHPDWIEYDRGTIEVDELIRRTAERADVAIDIVRNIVDSVPQSLTPVPGSVALAGEIRRRGHRLYYLSNMPQPPLDYLENHGLLDSLFAGGIASCREGLVKPDPEIFRRLLERFDLKESQTCFIDDTKHNIDAAEREEIRGVHFQNPEQCRKELEKIGIFG